MGIPCLGGNVNGTVKSARSSKGWTQKLHMYHGRAHEILKPLLCLTTFTPYQSRFISSICVMSVHLPKPLKVLCKGCGCLRALLSWVCA